MNIIKNVDLDFFIRFLKGIQEFIGYNCEIIVNDFRKGYDHTIVHAVNSELSGREVGGTPRGAMILHDGKNIDSLKDNYIFFYNGENGKQFKSCTTLIADDEGKVIGSVCINIEVSNIINTQKFLQCFLQTSNINKDISNDIDEISVNNVDDVLTYYISQAEQSIGKSLILMDKEEKVRALKYLDEKGVMKISKTNIVLCKALDISKFTLYNYLDEARKL